VSNEARRAGLTNTSTDAATVPVQLNQDELSRSFMLYELEATAEMLLMSGQPSVAPETQRDQLKRDHAPEALLVQDVLQGNRDQFGKLYALYAPLIHGILLARVPRDEVDDLVQDIFLHAFKKLHTLRNHAAFGPWIAMIARNRAVDFHRGSKEKVEVTEDLKSTSDPSVGQASEILEIIRGLPDAYRETLVLRLVEGMTGPEIASRTGLTPESVRVNLHRGMRLLRDRLGLKEKQ
jgi:RNA polymerase sigma-70 factor, ECF subfamily